MMDEVTAGNVAVCICKDLSRFGRDHLRVGLYTEALREHGVRFIAVQDNVDTARGDDDFTPFRNIINEWAARDSSRKVKAVMHSKGMSGKRLTSSPIYGYISDPEDKARWIVDPEAADVVRRIYRMTIDGMGPHEIAKALAAEKVERPSYYQMKRGLPTSHLSAAESPYMWNSATVSSIISKPEYAGHTVNFRSHKDSYKDKKSQKTPKEDWVIFENTHEGIIDAGAWESAQRLRKTVKRTDSLGEANPLTGKMFCADCGAPMYNHRKPYETPHVYPDGRVYTRCPSDIYSCSAHSRGSRKFEKICSLHHIRTAAVRELVLDVICRASAYVRGSEDEFIRQVREASAVRRDETARAHRRRIVKNEKRISELDMLFRKVYEDNAVGKLSDERFTQLSGAYENEQAEIKKQNAGLQAEVDGFEADGARADKFIALVRKYTVFEELTPAMINEFVDKIYVHEADKTSGKRIQQVDIYLNFIGMFPLPETERDPAEIENERKLDELRARRREYNRRYQAKKKGVPAAPRPGAPEPAYGSKTA
jgi:hypothetical protein